METPEQPKRPPWRPSEYRPEMCERLIEMGRDGLLVGEMAAALGVSLQTLHNWKEAHPDFLEAYGIARTYARAFYERRQRQLSQYEGELPLFGAKSNEFVLSRSFREDWGDKQEVLHSGSVEGLTIEFVNARHIAAEDEG